MREEALDVCRCPGEAPLTGHGHGQVLLHRLLNGPCMSGTVLQGVRRQTDNQMSEAS